MVSPSLYISFLAASNQRSAPLVFNPLSNSEPCCGAGPLASRHMLWLHTSQSHGDSPGLEEDFVFLSF